MKASPPDGTGRAAALMRRRALQVCCGWAVLSGMGLASRAGEPAPTGAPQTWWAFQPLRRTAPPAVHDAAQVRNPVDQFLQKEFEARKMTPLGPADRCTLLRRATFDLTGLPPTPNEIVAFLSDALERESRATRSLYGLDDPVTAGFGQQCLLARRLLERGVRFVHVFDTSKEHNPWDNHSKLLTTLPAACAGIDKPVAGFLKDLKARGLLEDTLVVWGGEFGRSPTAQGADGREHHPFGFTMWMTGGGVKGGHAHGETDEYGWFAVRDKVHVHDLHATMLYLLGLDHKKLTYRAGGRDYRLTDVYGNVVNGILA